MTDAVTVPGASGDTVTDIGRLLLSPTRTYAPLLKQLLTEQFDVIHGLIHCSGGGQTKCMKYLPGSFTLSRTTYLPPLHLSLIQQNFHFRQPRNVPGLQYGPPAGEIFADPAAAADLIKAEQSFQIEAKIVGRVEAADKLTLRLGKDEIVLLVFPFGLSIL